MSEFQLVLPPKMVPWAAKKASIYVAHGGRGSAKTRTMAALVLLYVMERASNGDSGLFVCGREFMNSLDDSSLAELKIAISDNPWMEPYFTVGEKFIRTSSLLKGRIDFAFIGMRHNLDSMKSKARVLGWWVDEAENVSEAAWAKFLPTVMREERPRGYVSYNPESPESATHKRFRANPSDEISIVEMNWRDNPWFPAGLEPIRLMDQQNNPDTYQHIWEGEFLTLTEAQVFAGKYEIREFEPHEKWVPYFGLDFGFAKDPMAMVEAYKDGQTLYWRRELYKAALDMHLQGGEIKKAFGDRVAKFDVISDSARPENISYLSKPISQTGGSFQLPRIKGAAKGKGSVEDGVDFIRSHHNVIHPSCTNLAKEFKLYSYKVDKQSGSVLPVLVDAYNHGIDAGRYALEPVMKRSNFRWDLV